MFDKQIIRLLGGKVAFAMDVLFAIIHVLLVFGQVFSLSAFIVMAWEGQLLNGLSPEAIMYLIVFVGCFVGRTIARVMRDSYMREFAYARTMEIREKLLQKVFDTGGALDSSLGSGAITSILIDGSHAIERYLKIIIPKTVDLMVVSLGIAIIVFTQDIISGIIIVVCYPCIILFMRLIGYTAKDESAKRHDAFIRMSGQFLDSIRGITTLKAFGVARSYANRVFDASEKYREAIMKTLSIATLSSAVLDIFATCGLAAVAIMLGFRMVEGSIALFPALVVLMLVPEYFAPVRAYASDYHATLDGKSALEKAQTLMDAPPRSVSIPDLALSVSPGEHVALVGQSGSGKTTVLDIIAGRVELHDGSVRADGSEIAYIPQSPHLITGTLRDNVALYKPEATDEEVLDALVKVGLSDVVAKMPDGISTYLAGSGQTSGSEGRILSGGEAHRVAIARALISNRNLWLLDEPGSDLDARTEQELHDAVRPLIDGKTAVIATHSDIWIDDETRVVDMTRCKVVEPDAA